MTSVSWTRVKDALARVLAQPAAGRAAAVDEACGDDAALRREVEALLASGNDMGDFLAAPLFGEPDAAEPAAIGVPPDLASWTRYEHIEALGRGGMAVVYKARDPRLQRPVAIKVISAGDPTTVARFLREAEAQARVEHDNVLKVYETGIVGPHHYIAMQYVAGPTLAGVRDETTLEQKVRLMLQIAEGLHAAHRQGLVHRDIKPGNILVERGEDGLKPYLLDFGLAVELGAAALTQAGVVVGTPRYMAPERVEGGTAALDRRGDIYSLGATFYEFLSGIAPFAGMSGLQVLAHVLHDELRPLGAIMPSLPRELDAVIAKCLEPDPQRRYGSARMLADDLRRYLDGEPVSARATGMVGRAARRARRHPRVAAAFLALAALVVAAAAWGGYGYWRTARQTALAQMLGQDMQDLEWMMRAAQMSPRHSIEVQKQEVRQRLARIEALVENAGAWARGPGTYTLGRGYLTLGDPARASEYLGRAWEAGYRTADAALALGLAHGELFRIETARAQRIASDQARATRIRALEIAHRDTALRFLEAGQSGSIAPPRYVEALIAAHRGDPAGATRKAEEAARETPWLFEARLLPGHLAMSQAVSLYLGGNAIEGAARARLADSHYAAAHAVAPSAFEAYLGRCAVTGLLLHMAVHRVTEPPAPDSDAPCTWALAVNPASSEAHRLYSEAVRYWADTRVLANEDPGQAYERAADLARRARDLSSGQSEDLAALAGAYMGRGWWESRSGRDPRQTVDLAVATFEQVLTIDPRNDASANEMGQTLMLRGRYEAANGLDSSESHGRAVESFMRALRISPSTAFHFSPLARAATERAAAHARQGLDPLPPLHDVLQFLERLPGNPDLPARRQAVATLRARIQLASNAR